MPGSRVTVLVVLGRTEREREEKGGLMGTLIEVSNTYLTPLNAVHYRWGSRVSCLLFRLYNMGCGYMEAMRAKDSSERTFYHTTTPIRRIKVLLKIPRNWMVKLT